MKAKKSAMRPKKESMKHEKKEKKLIDSLEKMHKAKKKNKNKSY